MKLTWSPSAASVVAAISVAVFPTVVMCKDTREEKERDEGRTSLRCDWERPTSSIWSIFTTPRLERAEAHDSDTPYTHQRNQQLEGGGHDQVPTRGRLWRATAHMWRRADALGCTLLHRFMHKSGTMCYEGKCIAPPAYVHLWYEWNLGSEVKAGTCAHAMEGARSRIIRPRQHGFETKSGNLCPEISEPWRAAGVLQTGVASRRGAERRRVLHHQAPARAA